MVRDVGETGEFIAVSDSARELGGWGRQEGSGASQMRRTSKAVRIYMPE